MMSQPPAAQQFRTVKIFKDQSLGLGSYGAVYRAKADRLPCAAKLLHPILFQDGDPGARRIQQRFEQECQFLSGIRHPNIVQYLGTCRDHESGLPALLMELMDESLTHFLENSPEPLPYYLEVNFSFNVALALDYLHSHEIIHRDLSSNNVLLISGSKAKVTDFGMSKLLNTTLHMTPQTQCPGTMVYMSPEALKMPPVYNKKLDCFSLGVLCIQIMTRQFPDPGPSRQVVEDPRSPVGTIEMPVLECERRKRHIDLITPSYPLLLIALRCLEYHDKNRPSAQELCEQLATLKDDPQYTQSVQHAQERGRGGASVAAADIAAKDEEITELQTSLAIREMHNQDLLQQLEAKERQIQQLQSLVQEKSRVTEQRERQLRENSRIIEEQERQLRELNHELQANEQVTAEFQQKPDSIPSEEKSIPVPREDVACEQEQVTPKATSTSDIALNWKIHRTPPIDSIGRNYGAAIADGDVVYVRYKHLTCAYNSQSDSWTNLPDCPNNASSLAVVNGLLTAIGGKKLGIRLSTLVSLSGEGVRKVWSEQFPPMPTKREKPAVVCSGGSLVAAGGHGDETKLSTVEVMDTDALQWFIASSLPCPLHQGSASICGDRLYMLGGTGQNGRTKSVLTCLLSSLLQSCQPQPVGGQTGKVLPQREDPSVWRRVADLPVYRSTCTTLCGQLLACGGKDDSHKLTDAVYKYDLTKNTWSVISHMPIACRYPLVAPLPGNKLFVCRHTDTYIGSIVQQ